ncbi:MAG TPA: D-aminoacylase [Methylomirabilota bacterium]|nr:D-aminoacylase [Methylomirabilota bacterium]
MPYDLLIRNGVVIDGTGRPGFSADIAIEDDHIVAVGAVSGATKNTIDAAGRIVTPGFIDVHSHDDFALLDRPLCDFKIMQGVTTEVIGNCGFGAAPAGAAYKAYLRDFGAQLFGPLGSFSWETTEEFFRMLEAQPASVNVAALIPHAAVRYTVLGADKRPPAEQELAHMQNLVREGMEAGAVGLSTGLYYLPHTKTEEVIALARVVGQYSGLYATHMRNEAGLLLDALSETLRIGEEAGVPVQISHHKAMGRENWGKVRDSLLLIEQARARGVDVSSDAYPYTAGSTTLSALAKGGSLALASAADVFIASTPTKHEYEGKTLEELCRLTGNSLKETVEQILAEEGEGVVAVIFGMDEADVRRVLTHPTTMIGSDGIPSVDGKPHPRLYGTFARVLGAYARDEGLFALEDAVYRMTGFPAHKFRLADRGVIHPGAFADLVIFDAQTIAERGTYQDPRHYPSGVDYVIVNGKVTADHGRHTGERSGKMLRLKRR